MLFRIIYGDNEVNESYNVRNDVRSILIFFIFLLIDGIYVLSYLSFSIAMMFVFLAFVFLFPFPIHPISFHLVFLSTLCFACNNVFAAGAQKGAFVIVLMLLTPPILFFIIWLNTLWFEFDAEITGYFFIDVIAVVVFMAVPIVENSDRIRCNIALSLGMIGILTALINTIHVVINDEKSRRLLFTSLSMFALGWVPIIVVFCIDIETSEKSLECVYFAIALLLYYLAIVIVVSAFSKKSAAYKTVGFAPLLVPLVLAMATSVLASPNTAIVNNCVAEEWIVNIARSFANVSKLKPLTYMYVFPRWLGALFRIMLYGEVLFPIAYALSSSRGKTKEGKNE